MIPPRDPVARALRTLLASRARPPAPDLATQLRYLEADVRELRARINALFFTVLAALLAGLLERLVA